MLCSYFVDMKTSPGHVIPWKGTGRQARGVVRGSDYRQSLLFPSFPVQVSALSFEGTAMTVHCVVRQMTVLSK